FVHSTQTPSLVSQTGVPPEQSLSLRHSTQVLLPELHRNPEPQLPSLRHSTHVPDVSSQYGWTPVQVSELLVHSTQELVDVLQTRLPVQSVSAVHSTQVCELVSQTPPAAQSSIPTHSTQVWVLVSQTSPTAQ